MGLRQGVTARGLVWVFGLGLGVALVGAVVMLTPTLEFLVVDAIEKLGLPIGTVGNFAFYAEFALLVGSVLGLVGVGGVALVRRLQKR